jgi:hypothetical protein
MGDEPREACARSNPCVVDPVTSLGHGRAF